MTDTQLDVIGFQHGYKAQRFPLLSPSFHITSSSLSVSHLCLFFIFLLLLSTDAEASSEGAAQSPQP